ncbi:Interferon-induced GTP-binding protein Mx1 [Diaporthe amygdali]|uniref:Interferon-induced GTP-binding protein Mx1 n=1 Tax=Phomopsis amygdali TaxID=1214568 RepID=UPI0022FDCB96|nr:Interferon-induced GTP-binding protein Mx1 [Diaporthe amygdali]KAJ0123005.1 Interferon-induced GTP-binding protein Mx1 [Diaporthe amygdali]
MGSTTKRDYLVEGLGNQALLDKIDKLRELNVGCIVSLPQLIVVGDQSSGKSSVLESLTGFSFPRAAGLCTRYATQIACRREPKNSVLISIIPRPDADDIVKQRLRKFRRCLDEMNPQDLADIFAEANHAMGIRSSAGDASGEDDGLVTFSEDVLSIEINGPDQPGLTVIDVPGIFRAATRGLTTESDITLVTSMVKRYMKDARTIILAVIPCNVDIATQEILRLAKDADPYGWRTMGVLTKPDLAPERAMQQNILELIQGKRQDLKLGYCLVKNRGADDYSSSLQRRDDDERAFFRDDPWLSVASSKRLGSGALKLILRDLLMDISKKEFPAVKKEITKNLSECRKKAEAMGVSRSNEQSQRAYLGKLAADFEKVVGYSLNAFYTENPIFNDRLEMRLITRIIRLNEVFSEVFSQRGHTRRFEDSYIKDVRGKQPQTQLPEVEFDIPSDTDQDLEDIIRTERFECPEPSDESIMEHIEDIFRKSRGPELGTFGGALLGTTFKEQSRRWEDLVMSHISDAIALVHHFIRELLAHVCVDKQVMAQLWDNVLLEKLQASYKRSMQHASFLLHVEREGKPTTYNHYFNSELQKGQGKRLQKSLRSLAISSADSEEPVIRLASLSSFNTTRSNPEQVREYLHDILESYYKVSVKRFVDVICQQVIDHFLLNGESSPLHVFSTELVFDLSADVLEMVAGEDHATRQERERLRRDIDGLEKAMLVLRG